MTVEMVDGGFVLIEVIASLMDGSATVEHHDMLCTCEGQELDDRNTCCTCSGDDDFDVLDTLACELETIDETRERDDGRTMLIVVKYGDIEELLEPGFDDKTLRSLEVLQIYPAESRCYRDDGPDDLLDVLCPEDDRDCIHICKFLKKDSLALHHRESCKSTDIPQTQDCRSVANDGYSIVFSREVAGSGGVTRYLQARRSDTRGVVGREVVPGQEWDL